jgi:hypothetical protein
MLNPTVKKIKKELRRGHKSIKLQRENRDFTTNSNEIHWIIREILKTCILINWKIWKKSINFLRWICPTKVEKEDAEHIK